MNTTWSRREFLELSGAAVGASLAPMSLRAGRVPPSDTVRFGMVGVGMQGSGLLGESIKLPGVACAGAADLYDGRHTLAREIAGAHLPVTRRYQQLLDDKTIDSSSPRCRITGTGASSWTPSVRGKTSTARSRCRTPP